jgi:hypothetical protein
MAGGKSMKNWAMKTLTTKTLTTKTLTMKTLTIAVAALTLMAMPAYAQMGGGRHHGGDSKKAEPVKKVDEKAYKAALERIPDSKEKYDPWAVTKPADAAKDSAKKPKTP